MLVSELFTESQSLLEKLGNLSQLKAGKLLPALMQRMQKYKTQKKTVGDKRSIEDKNDLYQHGEIIERDKVARNIGTKSEINDLGAVKNFAALKKAQEDNAGFALYLDDRCVFLIVPSDGLSARAATMKAAWDPRAFAGKTKGDEPKGPSGKQGRWWKPDKTGHKEEEDVVVTTLTPTSMKEMIDGLIAANPGKVTAKIITTDMDRVSRNYRNRHTEGDGEEFSGKEALKKRLAKYKLSKNPTAEDIEDFFKMALGGKNSKIQMDGKSYQIEAGYNNEVNVNLHNAAIFKGKPFKVKYDEIRLPGKYGGDSITITMKFFPETMTIGPVSIEHKSEQGDDHSKGKKVYNPEAHIMDKLGMTASSLTPASLTKYFDLMLAKSPESANKQLNILDGLEPKWEETVKTITSKVKRAFAKERISKLHDGSVKTRLDDE